MSYDLRRTRRLLVLLSLAARAARSGRGVPLDRARDLTGARSVAELMGDVAAARSLWVDPTEAEDAVDLYVEDGEVHVTYPQAFGALPAFSLAEGATLLAALAPFEADGERAVKGAVRKLRRAIPEVLRSEADRLVHGLDLALEPPGPWAAALQEAIQRRVETALEYRAERDGAASRRIVEPRLLFHRDGNWYLAAWNVAKSEEHLYRLDRIVSAEPGTRTFGEHKGPPVARYARRHLYFQSGAEREVTLRFRGGSARLARERWPSRAREHADGTVSVPMSVSPGNYLHGVVLGYGGEAEVEGPPDVAEAFRARAAELAAIYAGR